MFGLTGRTTRQAGSSQSVRGTSHQQRIRPIENIDNLLGSLYEERTGELLRTKMG
jgi:hypothetical protein